MIERQGQYYTLYCDYCSYYVDELDSFQEAVEYKKKNHWKSIKKNEEWTDKCLDCIEKGEIKNE